ncbi:MAG: biotin--[acetyl-CoA-carboxylase] ligase [Treponema sp.]|jgi:BirA family biotin operon repressor/biotin-[acetyl-CoA-carboxylase] ligase|nr:biotin--[acetyl-CoA-carboxylase] ligase [Treponema sp.]
MTKLEIRNPFNAPVYYEEAVESTMEVSRRLAQNGEPHGTVIAAGFQESGRGRIRDRIWQMEKNKGLPFTVLLRFPNIENIPPALTLRTGLAVSLAIEDFISSIKDFVPPIEDFVPSAPSIKAQVAVKWPNDIMIGSKKIAGILCEAGGGIVHIGIGVNFAQKEFPASIVEKATSIALAAGTEIDIEQRFCLLEKILACLYNEIETGAGEDWKRRLEQRLYKKNEKVVFIDGAVGSGKEAGGVLAGITETGELLIVPDGETAARSFITGEMVFPK